MLSSVGIHSDQCLISGFQDKERSWSPKERSGSISSCIKFRAWLRKWSINKTTYISLWHHSIGRRPVKCSGEVNSFFHSQVWVIPFAVVKVANCQYRSQSRQRGPQASVFWPALNRSWVAEKFTQDQKLINECSDRGIKSSKPSIILEPNHIPSIVTRNTTVTKLYITIESHFRCAKTQKSNHVHTYPQILKPVFHPLTTGGFTSCASGRKTDVFAANVISSDCSTSGCIIFAVVVVLMNDEPECVGVWWYLFSSLHTGCAVGGDGPLKIRRRRACRVSSFFDFREVWDLRLWVGNMAKHFMMCLERWWEGKPRILSSSWKNVDQLRESKFFDQNSLSRSFLLNKLKSIPCDWSTAKEKGKHLANSRDS